MSLIDIESLIPHRAPFRWIDRIIDVEPGRSCHAVTEIDPHEPFFAGHFPGDPVLPGVFLVEAAAQTAGVMLALSPTPRGTKLRLAAISQFKFLNPVLPGALLHVETKALVERDGMTLVFATMSVDGHTVATGQLTVVAS